MIEKSGLKVSENPQIEFNHNLTIDTHLVKKGFKNIPLKSTKIKKMIKGFKIPVLNPYYINATSRSSINMTLGWIRSVSSKNNFKK